MSGAATANDLRIDVDSLLARIHALAEISPIDGGGNSRLALTDADREARDLVVLWMRDLDLDVSIDAIGNVVGVHPGHEPGPPVMTGSHIDTVRTGGRYDGNLGVLAGLEVVETLVAADVTTRRPLAVAFFTNEEGARFPPDMMGSLVYVGGMPVEEALDVTGIDGARVGDELVRVGYAGELPCPNVVPHAFVELHIEQGPVLEAEGTTIGAVESVQGISWQELTIVGQANHAGTTPMPLRLDAGSVHLEPDLVNVIAARAVLTVDLRNTGEERLQEAERRVASTLDEIAAAEGVTVTSPPLARFEPVEFDPRVVDLVERTARARGHSVRRLPSGAGHDAQMLARVCPAGMIFVPSRDGIGHNPAEHTDPEHLAAGADVLLHTLLELATADA